MDVSSLSSYLSMFLLFAGSLVGKVNLPSVLSLYWEMMPQVCMDGLKAGNHRVLKMGLLPFLCVVSLTVEEVKEGKYIFGQ